MPNPLRAILAIMVILVGLAQLASHAVVAFGIIGLGLALFRQSRVMAMIFGAIVITGFFVSPRWNVYILIVLAAPLALLLFGLGAGATSKSLSTPPPARPNCFGATIPCSVCNGASVRPSGICSNCDGSGFVY